MNLMLQPYRRYFDFNGRSRRSEFWLLKPPAVVANNIPLCVFREITDVLAAQDVKRTSELSNFLYEIRPVWHLVPPCSQSFVCRSLQQPFLQQFG